MAIHQMSDSEAEDDPGQVEFTNSPTNNPGRRFTKEEMLLPIEDMIDEDCEAWMVKIPASVSDSNLLPSLKIIIIIYHWATKVKVQ